jgi:uncharacterized membrane protein YsdA (DUF1294 family)
MSTFDDRRNRLPLVAAAALGIVLFLVLWLVLGWSPLLAWLVGWTPPAFAAYGVDKWQAAHGGWRIPEIVLHGLALVGGVIGAWAGRFVFRHKTRKPVFLWVLIAASVLWGVIAGWAILGR